MSTDILERPSAEAFGERVMHIINEGALALMVAVGHRTALFDTMASMPPAGSAAIARAANLSERYVREWLGAMVTGGIVTYDRAADAYSLPAEHAACLTRAASPNNMAVTAQWISLLGGAEDAVVGAFRHGKGVPYGAYPRFHEVMAEESEQTVVAGLFDHILPLVRGSLDRLAAGIDVLDVACGSGRAIVELAETFPASRSTGIDMSAEAVAAATADADRRGVTNARFVQGDVAELNEARAYDLVTAFDAIHDQARPAQVLARIRAALRPGGALLMQDIAGRSHVADNGSHPLGPFLYTISCLHCMSVSLAAGGPGLGAMWGRERALEMLGAAGFGKVTVESLPHDPINDYYICAVE
jgi:2-polyprenyl-3-methyl-5-hydroxy-6-metoxy-1,4-benzoquinol methylase